MIVKGRVWIFGDDIDTDQIYPGKYLPLTDKAEMARHAMEGTERGEEFIAAARNGDVIIAGKNFGCGSSREHAAVAIKGIGIPVVIARSFARIFHRNCVNTGLAILLFDEPERLADADIIEVDTVSGRIHNITRNQTLSCRTLSSLEREIMEAGGLLEYLKKQG